MVHFKTYKIKPILKILKILGLKIKLLELRNHKMGKITDQI